MNRRRNRPAPPLARGRVEEVVTSRNHQRIDRPPLVSRASASEVGPCGGLACPQLRPLRCPVAAASIAASADKYRRPRTIAVPSAFQVPLGHRSSAASADASRTAAPVRVAAAVGRVSGGCGMAATSTIRRRCRSPAVAAGSAPARIDGGRPNGPNCRRAGVLRSCGGRTVSGVCWDFGTGRPPGRLPLSLSAFRSAACSGLDTAAGRVPAERRQKGGNGDSGGLSCRRLAVHGGRTVTCTYQDDPL